MRYTGPRNRLARRENLDLGLKTPGSKAHASLLKKLNVPPGQHGTKGKRKVSEHGKQLREKQKLRFTFGITETKLSSYFAKAKSKTGNTAKYLSEYLEKRLDNVVMRMGFAPTRPAARQLIAHKHVKVNGHILSAPSYQVKVGDIITFNNEKSSKIPYIEAAMAKNDIPMPAWFERQGTAGKMISEPTGELIEKQFNLRLVVEFYSR